MYRKVETRIWNDEKFRALSDDGKLICLFILTHPNMTRVGAMRATVPGLAVELGWTAKRFAKGFKEGLGERFPNGWGNSFQGVWFYDESASFLCLPNFIKYNKPDNPNVVQSWEKVYRELPECAMLSAHFNRLGEYVETLSEGFTKRFPKGLPKPLPKGYPKQDQEQEQEQKKKEPPQPPKGGGDQIEFPDVLNTSAFKAAWVEWEIHRKEIRHKLTPSTIKKCLKDLAKMGHTNAIESINRSISNGWQGLFPPDGKKTGTSGVPAHLDPDRYKNPTEW